MIAVGPDQCTDLEIVLRREWLETDGLGGFACGTVAGAHTRRYHGLLVAATQPPVGRRVLLSKLEETLQSGGASYPLSTNLYRGAVHPVGYQHLTGFRLDPWPVWSYRARAVALEKAVFMPHGLGVTAVRYTLTAAPEPVWLNLRPLLACRDYHHLGRSSGGFHTALSTGRERFSLQPYDLDSRVSVYFPGGEFWPDGMWYYDFSYPREQERGLDCEEDLYSPGEIRFLLGPGQTAWVLAGRDSSLEVAPEAWEHAERERRSQLVAHLPDPVGRQLALAADQFVVRRRVDGDDLRSLVAGYPWFTDWGRDAMIALPGLLLSTGRAEEAAQVLRAFAGHLRGGLLPNTFGDDGRGAAYNTVDAALWFVHAVRQYADRTGDLGTVRAHLFGPVQQILAAYREGTDYGIGMDADGLIRAGSEETQLTWMDAKVGDAVFTPRAGKPVEINGLWHSALATGALLAREFEPASAGDYLALAQRVAASFEQAFWCEASGYYHDYLGNDGPNSQLRPNQVIALSLPDAPGTLDHARRALEAVDRHLLTPYGLRTLAPADPHYHGRYEGDQWRRDSAYHNGTVWPWLLGPYGSAWARVEQGETLRRRLRAVLQPLVDYLFAGGLGTLPEVFDGDAPHLPGGTFAQAWSVAEVLRLWLEYRLDEV